MTWYERAKMWYPINYMSIGQLDRIYSLGWITEEQHAEIKLLKTP